MVGGNESHGMAVTADGKTLVIGQPIEQLDLLLLASRPETHPAPGSEKSPDG
jgi:hypothetical protein